MLISLSFLIYPPEKKTGGEGRGGKRRRVLTENSRISIQGIYRSYMYTFLSASYFLRKGYMASKIMAPKMPTSSSLEPVNTLSYTVKGALTMWLWV